MSIENPNKPSQKRNEVVRTIKNIGLTLFATGLMSHTVEAQKLDARVTPTEKTAEFKNEYQAVDEKDYEKRTAAYEDSLRNYETNQAIIREIETGDITRLIKTTL